MRPWDILRASAANTVRSKLRTSLTVVALVIGAFTLTITTALGAGVSNYLDTQVGALGSDDVVLVSAADDSDLTLGGGEGPTPYDPDRSGSSAGGVAGGTPGFSASRPLSDADLETIESLEGVTAVEPVRIVATDYVRLAESSRYEFSINPQSAVTRADLAAGDQLDQTSAEPQVHLPTEYLDALGFASAEDAVGATVFIAITTLLGDQTEVEATVTGVSRSSLLASGAGANSALIQNLVDARAGGLDSTGDRPTIVIAYLENGADADALAALRSELEDAGFSAQTIEDQLGIIQTVITGITGVLNAFGIIALLAAAFGIINTLLMSVQERTREIGLMKAMGMGTGSVFTLFSLEAVIIGLLGSGIGVLLAMVVGTGISGALAAGPLADLDGLTLLMFEPGGVLAVIALITVIAFLAGTLPANRAARLRPIDALRYE